MHRNTQNSDYRSYSYLSPSISSSLQNFRYQYYDPRIHTQQSIYPSTAPTLAYTSSLLQQQQQQQHYQPSRSIYDLAEPLSVFDDLKFPRRRRSNIISLPPIYIPPNPSQQILVSDARLATASAIRERLLIDIQHNINEIDREITSLEQQSIMSLYVPSRLSSLALTRQQSSINQMWLNKPKKIYNVIPRIESQQKMISPNSIEQTTSQLFFNQYHYAAETEEIVINENDPENNDLKLFVREITNSNSQHKQLSLDQFRREQSALPQNRALISVPEYVDNTQTGLNEATEDIHQTNPINTDIAQVSTVYSANNSGASNKLSIEDFKLFTHTAPESKAPTPLPSKPKSDEVSNKTETNLINTIPSKPVKHARLSTKPEETLSSSQETIMNTKNNTDVDKTYFFSDFGNEGEGEEDLLSIDQNQFALPAESEIIPDDNISNILIRQSQTSLLNPHSLQHQQQRQLIIQNNNEPVKETESKKIDETTKHIITSTSTLPSPKKLFPISIYDNMQTQFTSHDNNINQDQREMPTIISGEQSSINESNNLSPSERKTSSKNMNSHRKHSASSYQSSHIISRESSINSADIRKSSKQQTPAESRRNSPLPVPLNSPDINNVRPSTSRSTTPERRNSIPFLNQNILLTSIDINNLINDSNTDHLPTNSERDIPSPLVNFVSLPENQLDELKFENNEETNHSPSPSIYEQENIRLKSVSPVDVETKEIEHDNLRLPSISPRHSIASNANLTSADREETARQSPLPDLNNNELNNSEPKLLIEDTEKHSTPMERQYPPITASQQRSKLSLHVHQSEQETHTIDLSEKKIDRHVLFTNNISHTQMEENNSLNNWRERIDKVLTKKHFSSNKYSHIKSRVNSFGNFEYQSRKFITTTKRKLQTKNDTTTTVENKLKNRQIQSKQTISQIKESTRRNFGPVGRLSDGRPKIFHEKLNWNVPSKIKSYSLENLHYKPRRSDIKIINKKPRWHSESRVAELIKSTPRRRILTQTISLPIIFDNNEVNFYEQQESENEMKIFDINSIGQQSMSKFPEKVNASSWTSKRSEKSIFDEKLVWRKKSKLKDLIWGNINYQPKKSRVQIFHQPTHWNQKSKIQITHSLTLDIQAKVKYWSEIDLHQLTKKKALFSQYDNPKWNDIIIDNNNNYPYISLTQNFELKDYVEENFNDQTQEESPANRPKWNSVSKTRSVNSVYNPKLPNENSIRRGWDLELRRKRVHKLPPLKRKKVHNETPQLTIEAPLLNDDIYDHSLVPHELTTSIDYTTTPSRKSSKALGRLSRLPDLQLLSETPRSQRPVQQEWYDELNKSRSTHRTEKGRTRNNSFQESIASIHQTNTPRDLRSSTRNSQNSVMSGALLDSSIRTNRATELRLSRDMEEHHQHSHDPNQSMPFEIRGFRLEGTQLTVPDHATIRPLSNISYHTSERVKTRRLYPWSTLHPNGTLSRNSSLLPITEFRHPSFETSIVEVPQLIHEE